MFLAGVRGPPPDDYRSVAIAALNALSLLMILTRREAITATCIMVSGGLAGCTGNDDGVIEFTEDFEDELSGWETASHIGPEAFDEFDWSIERSQEEARSGDWSLAIYTEGRFDDGTAWIVRPISVTPGHRYEVAATLYAWSRDESFNVVRHLVAFFGEFRPAVEEDFPPPGVNTTDFVNAPIGGFREPLDLAPGWREYGFEWITPRLEREEVYFAVGISVVWEADRTHFIDNITLRLTPLED